MPQAFQKLGRYLITQEIAQGGMATIYRAKLIGVAGFEKDVAIKKILPFWSHQKEFIDMLIDEAKVLVHLSHSNIVQVIELGKENENYFIVMEYVPGFDLKKIVRKLIEYNQTMPLDLACYVIKQVCLGLEFAHTRKNRKGEPLNIIHRDISPQNILVSIEGDIKITDFGIAKVIGKTSETATGILKGKFSYMSPEQALGSSVDQRTDVFALGALFYEIVTGKKCFDGSNDLEIIELVKNAAVTYPPALCGELIDLLQKSLAKNVHERFQTAADFRHELEAIEKTLGLHASGSTLRHFLKNYLQQEVSELAERENATEKNTRLFYEDTDGDGDTTAIHRTSSVATVIDRQTVIHDTNIPNDPSGGQKKQHVARETKILLPPQKKYARKIYWGALTALGLTTCLAIILAKNSSLTKAPSATQLSTPVTIERLNGLSLDPEGKTTRTIIENIKRPEHHYYFATLMLIASPSTATITTEINGEKITATGKLSHVFALADKGQRVPVNISLDGYREQNFTLDYNAAHLTRQKDTSLEKLRYGSVLVKARPWGYATIKGVGTHTTDATFKVPTGPSVVTVFHPGSKKSVSQAIFVKTGTAMSCQATFGEKANFMTCN